LTTDRQDLIAYRLERARQTLEEAEALLKMGHANAYVNRLYYACFYAVLALLLTRNVSARKHRQVRTLLHRDYVKPGLVPVAMGKHFDLLFDSRQEGDYADFAVFEVSDVQPWLEPTKSFVNHIAELVAREMQRDVP
jgi:uncharacterized protein